MHRSITPQQQHQQQPLQQRHSGTPPRSNSQQGRQSQQSLDSIGKLSRGSSSPSANPYMAALESAIGQLHLSKSATSHHAHANNNNNHAASTPNIVHNNLRNGSSLQVSNNDLHHPQQPPNPSYRLLQQPIPQQIPEQDLSHMRGSEV